MKTIARLKGIIAFCLIFHTGAALASSGRNGEPPKSAPPILCAPLLTAKNLSSFELDKPLTPEESVTARLVKATAKFLSLKHVAPTISDLVSATKIDSEKIEEALAELPKRDKVLALVQMAKEQHREEFRHFEITLATVAGKYLRDSFTLPETQNLLDLLEVSHREYKLYYEGLGDTIELIQKHAPAVFESIQTRMMQKLAKEAERMGKTPTIQEFALIEGADPRKFGRLFHKKGLFESFNQLVDRAIQEKPSFFESVIDTRIFNEERTESLVKALKKNKRFVVTTAVAGSPVNRRFFDALLKYCELNDAEILVYPANMQTTGLDEVLLNTPKVHIITNTYELGPHFALNRIKLIAKQINPLMGLDRIGPRGQSQIVGSPKMHVKTLATVDNYYEPHRLMTTGALTDPFYDGRRLIQGRTDEIASADHVLGALILEKSNRDESQITIGGAEPFGHFHHRHIEFIPEKEGFMDLGKFYTGTEVVGETRPEALVLGDIHVGDTDGRLLESLKNQILTLRPKRLIVHDILNGHSISHHDKDRVITMAKKAMSGKLNLKEELEHVTHFINSVLEADPEIEVVIAHSNHDSWLTKWLEAGRFNQDPQNTEIGLELAYVYQTGGDPFKHALLEPGLELPHRPTLKNESRSKVRTVIQDRNRVIFLEAGNSLKIGPAKRQVEVGFHGHSGANGARGSIRTAEIATGRSVFGHTHTYERRNGTVNVGTSTLKVLPYTKDGFSSWVQSAALVGQNGEIQVLEFHDGAWYADPNGKTSRHFYLSSYPKVQTNSVGNAGGQVDQHGGK